MTRNMSRYNPREIHRRKEFQREKDFPNDISVEGKLRRHTETRRKVFTDTRQADNEDNLQKACNLGKYCRPEQTPYDTPGCDKSRYCGAWRTGAHRLGIKVGARKQSDDAHSYRRRFRARSTLPWSGAAEGYAMEELAFVLFSIAFVLTLCGIWKAGEKITNKIKERKRKWTNARCGLIFPD